MSESKKTVNKSALAVVRNAELSTTMKVTTEDVVALMMSNAEERMMARESELRKEITRLETEQTKLQSDITAELDLARTTHEAFTKSVDVATPLARRQDIDDIAQFYCSIGQSF